MNNCQSLLHILFTFIKLFKKLSFFILCKNWFTVTCFLTPQQIEFMFRNMVNININIPFFDKINDILIISFRILNSLIILLHSLFISLLFRQPIRLKKLIIFMLLEEQRRLIIKFLSLSIRLQTIIILLNLLDMFI